MLRSLSRTRSRRRNRIGDLSRIYLMREFWGILPLMECADAGANLLISRRDPLTRPEIIQPRLHHESFIQVFRVDGAPIDPPPDRAVAKPHASQLMNCTCKLDRK